MWLVDMTVYDKFRFIETKIRILFDIHFLMIKWCNLTKSPAISYNRTTEIDLLLGFIEIYLTFNKFMLCSGCAKMNKFLRASLIIN